MTNETMTRGLLSDLIEIGLLKQEREKFWRENKTVIIVEGQKKKKGSKK